MKLTAHLALLGFIASIPASNWMIGHIGYCSADGPCVLPVFPGIMAPSAVLLIGVALVLRDHVHHSMGSAWAFLAILVGAAVSLAVSTPTLALAAGAAFLISETADLVVYAPLRQQWPASAVLVSGVVGAAVDSFVFLGLAYADMTYLQGQTIGKIWASLLAAVAIRFLAAVRGA